MIRLLPVILALAATPALAKDTQNLLSRPDLQFLQAQSIGLDLGGTLKIKDARLETAATLSVSEAEPVELVFSFTGELVTPTALKIQNRGLAKDTALIEILVSEDGPDTGFLSLRAEPLSGRNGWQRFKFEPAAAKWLMLKVTAFDAPVQFDLLEIEVEGHAGAPVSLYAFDEAPSDALEVLKSLEATGVSLDIHPDETALFADAADGSLDQFTFAEASLLSSGVYDPNQRAQFLSEIDALTQDAKTITANAPSAFDKGKILLEWLHQGAMQKGYVERQTDMSVVLQQKLFNCVSSATLYNILARRLGLDARGIEVPDHAFSILYDGTEHVDVETTTPRGFDPARNRAAMTAFARTTGYTYISDKNRAKRREIDAAGMVALTYYNHGVGATEDGDYPTALLHYFRALSLDPRNNSAIKNTLVVLGRWSKKALEANDPIRAISILDAALNFAPKDRTSRHNMRYALSKAMRETQDADETKQLVARARDMHARTGDSTFLRLEGQVLQSKAYSFAKRGDYETALDLTQSLGPDADERTKRDMTRLRGSLYLNWSNDALDKGEFATAMDVLERAIGERNDYRIKNNIAYVAQEWGAAVSATQGAEAAQSLLLEIAARFPKIRKLQSVAARNYHADGGAAFNAGDFETAIEIYQAAQMLGVDASKMARNEKAAWTNWGLTLLDQGDYAGALAVYEQGLAAHPSHSKIKNNVAYIVQEWAREVSEREGLIAAERIIAAQRARFASVSGLKRMQGLFINKAVNAAKEKERFAELAPMVKEAEAFTAQKSRYDKMVAYFYQEWAKAEEPEFANDAAIAVLQGGYDLHRDNRALKRLFLSAATRLGDLALQDGNPARALSIYQSAARSLPKERGLQRKIEAVQEQL